MEVLTNQAVGYIKVIVKIVMAGNYVIDVDKKVVEIINFF